ncbi:PriCT-2 domain-containing protein [Ruegeria sp. WL0004]|uniref:PriCT-2 domain-containing protein n=1 Tax=Ruegeria marisflavi TaxID=2984152 RepID=A0ABT2WMP3_9RHOB|nr:DUF5906 domain-containing protein [Ruegeria sp. WL0004]MCU9837164.1 PriCT-2 domain-containing protein [Ruegeria sp. WL0004]
MHFTAIDTASQDAWSRAIQERNWAIFAITRPEDGSAKLGKYPTGIIPSEYQHERGAWGQPISVYDAAHWTFSEACQQVKTLTPPPGILRFAVGYLPRPGSALVIGDLDNCRDPLTGAISPWAAQILALESTYAEVSTSGTGIRLLMERQDGDDQHSSGERSDTGFFANGSKGAVLTFQRLNDAMPVAAPAIRNAIVARKGVDPERNHRVDGQDYGEVGVDLLRAVVMSIPNDGRYRYDDWVAVGHAIQTVDDGQAGWEIFRDWSDKFPGKRTENTVRKWQRGLKANGTVGFGTLVYMARGHKSYVDGGRMPPEVEAMLDQQRIAQLAAKMPPVEGKAGEIRAELVKLVGASPVTVDNRLRELKADHGIGLGALRAELSQLQGSCDVSDERTHSQIADHFFQTLPEPKTVPNAGAFWNYDADVGIWRSYDVTKVAAQIGRTYVGEKNCKRQSDYRGITQHLYDTWEDERFFRDAPRGIMAADAFYRLQDGRVVCEPKSPEHRATFALTVQPDFNKTPDLFLRVLREAFTPTEAQLLAQVGSGSFANLEAARQAYQQDVDAQLRNLQKAFGGTLFGLMTKYEKAPFLYGAAGSFKSKTIKVLESLIDADAVCSVSPQDMGSDYDRSFLSQRLLNVVPEIDSDEPVAAGSFKSMISGDTMKGRNPFERPFKFEPMAAHWFAGNYYITTKDTSKGFWRRWLVFRFWSGKDEADRDQTLLPRIMESELPAIVAWAFRGVELLIAEGFTETHTHRYSLTEWSERYDSVLSWLHAEDSGVCRRQYGDPLPNTEAFQLYKQWCMAAERRPLGRNKFLDRLAEAGHPQSRRLIGTLERCRR